VIHPSWDRQQRRDAVVLLDGVARLIDLGRPWRVVAPDLERLVAEARRNATTLGRWDGTRGLVEDDDEAAA
jgi:hypothetical protein